ncbi:hypothetical protein DPX16_1814 [Anabarilius grahami]|uniref:Uncharacterized protein n=1 Tax=Anabarilius grahami TaxID=495550 RepID=A0A3N0Y6U5_ANAGA|nr:hypothetical protein DPX16_1814 [Anabarilius grahami]
MGTEHVTGTKGGNATLSCELEDHEITDIVLSRQAKNILFCQNDEYEISVKIGEKVKLHVLLTNAGKVEHQNINSTEWTELWKRGDKVQSDRLNIREETLIINNFTVTDTGTYRVLDSDNETLITVTVTIKDFQEFIDTDVNAGVRELDKFQIHYIATNTQDLFEGSVQPLQMDIEFSKLTDGKEDFFIRKWEGSIIPKLKQIAPLEKKNDIQHLLEKANHQQDDELCYTMLKILIHLLPPTASGRSVAGSKCCVNSAVSYLLEQVPAGTNVSSLLSESMSGSLKSAQPQLVSIGSLQHGAQYVIVAKNDSFVLPLDVESLTFAVDRLFKFFWLCNLQYPCQLSSVFSFFEYIYDLPLT